MGTYFIRADAGCHHVCDGHSDAASDRHYYGHLGAETGQLLHCDYAGGIRRSITWDDQRRVPDTLSATYTDQAAFDTYIQHDVFTRDNYDLSVLRNPTLSFTFYDFFVVPDPLVERLRVAVFFFAGVASSASSPHTFSKSSIAFSTSSATERVAVRARVALALAVFLTLSTVGFTLSIAGTAALNTFG